MEEEAKAQQQDSGPGTVRGPPISPTYHLIPSTFVPRKGIGTNSAKKNGIMSFCQAALMTGESHLEQ